VSAPCRAHKEKMGVIRHQRPCVANNMGFREKVFDAPQKIIAVVIISENMTPLDTTNDDVVQNTGRI
jgi:hypothetical protein